MRIVLLIVVFLVMTALHAVHADLPENVGARAALVFGFLLIAGFILGEILARWSLPRITGYLLAGMACGPSVLGLVDREVIEYLRLVDDLALVLIAFTAGAELKADRLRNRIRSITQITWMQTTLVFVAVTGTFWLLRPYLSFCQGLNHAQYLAVAAVLGLIATATSPSTAVAVILEARSKGPVTDTVLGTTVLKDIVVLVGFSLVMSLASPQFESGTGSATAFGWVVLEILLSFVTGGVFGTLVVLYLRFVGREKMLFVVASAFLIISVSEVFHLDHLLVAVVAGYTVSNYSRQGGIFMHGLELASAPVFLVFFSLAGAGLNLSVLASIWHLALLFVALRTVFTWLGTAGGARLARDPPAVRKFAWTGFLGQAGVSLGLAALARDSFPGVGGFIANLIVGAVVLNQLVGPVVFRYALVKTGEAQQESE